MTAEVHRTANADHADVTLLRQIESRLGMASIRVSVRDLCGFFLADLATGLETRKSFVLNEDGKNRTDRDGPAATAESKDEKQRRMKLVKYGPQQSTQDFDATLFPADNLQGLSRLCN